jgi:hypothetical protein
MTKETYRNDELEDWCLDIDPDNEYFFKKRLEATGIFQHPLHFNIYLKKRLPDNKFQHVALWKDELPNSHEIGCTFGSGEAVIDFEVLPGRYSGKKRRGVRIVHSYGESYDEFKRQREKNIAK